MSPAASSLPVIPAQASVLPIVAPPIAGAMPKANVETAARKNPPQSMKSSRLPSTEKRIPARTATIAAASVTAVSSTSRSCGRSYVSRSEGYATNSANPAASRPKRTTSPQSHAE